MNYIKLREVMKRTSLGKNLIYTLMKTGDFPQSIKLSARRQAWIESEVDQWMKEKFKESRPMSKQV